VNCVAVRILHVEADSRSGPLETFLAEASAANAERLLLGFLRAGASDVEIASSRAERVPFAARLRALVSEGLRPDEGLILLGSGSIPLARATDLRAFVAAAASGERRALVNNRYSADIVAAGQTAPLAELPELPGDNALPRWLEEVAGYLVDDLRRRTRLAMDLDSPLDVALVASGQRSRRAETAEAPADGMFDLVEARLAALRSVAGDRRAELLVSGRTSAGTLGWLERSTRARVRALVEERGLRASAGVALGTDMGPQRPPRSALGFVLDDRGPEGLGDIVAELADGAFIDSRVLLAHRLGSEERGWPVAEDRFASDLLLADQIRDPWLRALTAAARDASVPILLGGHSLVGPGIRLALRADR
jgi:hypothetical protein